MFVPIEVDGKKLWADISIIMDRVIREYQIDDARVIEIDRIPKVLKVDEVITDEEFSKGLIKNIKKLQECGWTSEAILLRLSQVYGVHKDHLEPYLSKALPECVREVTKRQ